MIADLHTHCAMHLLGEDAGPSETYDRLVRVRRRPGWVDRLRALLIRVFARTLNYRDEYSSWRVTLDGLERGRTGVLLSVLYEPFAQIDPPRRRDRADLARHQLQDGRADGEGNGHTVATIRAHVDAIRAVTRSHADVAIGSDLDGFIKPTMSGIESAEHLALLEDPLREAYPDDADAILSRNVARVVRRVLDRRAGVRQ